MKKSTRILAVLMAFVMLMGTFSVMGSAYQAYKGNAIANSYDDVDKPVFTLEQYASMGLDEIDRMLAKEQIVLNIYIGELNLSSVSGTIASLESLLSSIQSLLPLLGDASSINIDAVRGMRRNVTQDQDIIKGVLNLLGDIAGIAEKYVNGTISLGILTSLVSDYLFNVRELATGLLYQLLTSGYVNLVEKVGEGANVEDIYMQEYNYFKQGTSGIPEKYLNTNNGIFTILQELLNLYVLGEWKKLNDDFNNKYSYIRYDSYEFKTLYGETAPDTEHFDYYGWKHPEDWVTNGLGGCLRVNRGEPAPDPIYTAVDCTTNTVGYDFIENLMRQAYNYILVPVLNEQTAPWLRKTAGVVYDEKYTRRTVLVNGEWVNNPDYDPNYKGDASNVDPTLGNLFNLDVVIPTVDFSTDYYRNGGTFVGDFNRIIGDFIKALLKDAPVDVESTEDIDWSWDYESGNAALLTNACSVVRYVLQKTGGYFFYDFVADDLKTATQLENLSNEQLLGYLLGTILNCFVPWMYIDLDANLTLVEVGYSAVEQLAWQDIPQYTYTKPDRSNYVDEIAYDEALVDKALTILFDVATYNLNQGFDMVPINGADPLNGAGLIQYQGDNGSWQNTMIPIVVWALTNYASILAVDFNCNIGDSFKNETQYANAIAALTIDDVWEDLDTLINAIIPIKGNGAWIAASIANQPIVSKNFIFENILNSIYTLDASGITAIFDRNPSSEFATKNGVQIIVSFLRRIFNALAPNVFSDDVDTVDGILDNNLLGKMVYDFLNALGTRTFTGKTTGRTITGRADDLVKVALPIVCLALGLSDDQEFGEMAIYLPETLAAGGDTPAFSIYNTSSGINTGYTNRNGSFSQDNLYKYVVHNVVINTIRGGSTLVNAVSKTGIDQGTVINGGDNVQVTLNGALIEGDIIEFVVSYYVYGENNTPITTAPLSATAYSYVGANAKSDDELETEVAFADGQKLVYTQGIYLNKNEKLSAIENYSLRVKAETAGGTAQVTAVNAGTAASWLEAKGDAPVAVDSGNGSIFFMNPFKVKADAERVKDVLDEEGEVIGTEGNVEDGDYNVTSTVTINGVTKNITTGIHLYNDFGLTSLYNKSVKANRQLSNYDTEKQGGRGQQKYDEYKAALQKAASLVLRPKTTGSFATMIAATDNKYVNLYEQYAKELETAIEELSAFEKNAGTKAIADAVDEVSGLNYIRGTKQVTTNGVTVAHDTLTWIETYDPNYKFFGMHDYVPHTYNRYKDARKRANNLIDSQYIVDNYDDDFVPANEDEAKAYNEFNAEYAEKKAAIAPVNAVDAAYAIHMVELMGERLIALPATKVKFDGIYALCTNIDTSKNYTTETWTNYQNARSLADRVNNTDESQLKPSEVNTAASDLMDAWKRLVESADYTNLNAAITVAQAVVDIAGDSESQTVYTKASYDAFYSAYTDAINLDKGLANLELNQQRIDATALALTTAQAALEYATAGEATWDITTEYLDLFFSMDYEYEFIPTLEEDKIDYYGPEYEDGIDVDAYIYGVGCYIESEDDYIAIFPEELRENCDVVVIPNKEKNLLGTGTTIQIVDLEENVLATYQVILFGDVDGNSLINEFDVSALDSCIGGVDGYDWEWNSNEQYNEYFAIAADLDGDYMISANDFVKLQDAVDPDLGWIDQQTGIYKAY